MAQWSSQALLRPDVLAGNIGSAGTPVLTVGNERTAAVNYNTGGVQGNLADATTGAGTIDSPGAWTDIITISGDSFLVQVVGVNKNDIGVANTEDVGDAIRTQILIDGTVVYDAKCVGDGANDLTVACNWFESDATTYATIPIYCVSSFNLRATRVGNFGSAGSYLKTGDIYYYDVALV